MRIKLTHFILGLGETRIMPIVDMYMMVDHRKEVILRQRLQAWVSAASPVSNIALGRKCTPAE